MSFYIVINKYLLVIDRDQSSHAGPSIPSVTTRDCNPGIPDVFLKPESQVCRRPNPGISGLENYLLNCLLNNKFRSKRTYIIIKRRSDVVY